jgi:hypothetical protein
MANDLYLAGVSRVEVSGTGSFGGDKERAYLLQQFPRDRYAVPAPHSDPLFFVGESYEEPFCKRACLN